METNFGPNFAILIRICRRPGAKIRDFCPDFKMSFEVTFGGPGMNWAI